MSAELPDSAQSWAAAASHYGVHNGWITASSSGSEFKYAEFLMLRAYWPSKIIPTRDLSSESWMDGTLRGNLGAAKLFLNRSSDFKSYLASLDPGRTRGLSKSSVNVGGVYALARYYQFLSAQEKATSESVVSTPKVAMFTRSRARQYYMKQQQTTPTKAGRPTTSPSASPKEDNLDDFIDGMQGLKIGSHTPTTGGSPTSSSGNYLSPQTPLQSWGSSSAEAVEDEQIINTALILFLNALTLLCPEVTDHWSLFRRPFTYCSPTGEKVYEARVDGLLRSSTADSDGTEARIIVEVKPCYRCVARKQGSKSHVPKPQIRMQETAQMVAWIYESHKSARYPRGQTSQNQRYRYVSINSWTPTFCLTTDDSRLMISQDQQEIYVTIARYDDDYVSYLRQEQANESFLEMTDYGPFSVKESLQMKVLSRLMLAFSLNRGC